MLGGDALFFDRPVVAELRRRPRARDMAVPETWKVFGVIELVMIVGAGAARGWHDPIAGFAC
jgi:hypothetical protein